jgi:hypothetical protein
MLVSCLLAYLVVAWAIHACVVSVCIHGSSLSDSYLYCLWLCSSCTGQNLTMFRNCFFQVAYISLVGLIHACVIYDGLRVVLMVDPNTNPLTWPFILVTINLLAFMVSSLSNPGVLSQHGNGASLLQHSLSVYPYDGVIFEPGATCPTCNIIKPARSKHCSKY